MWEKSLPMKKLFITGGAGFIGGNFILQQLEKTNNFIINFDNLTYAGDLTKFKNQKNNPNYKFVKGNICNRNLVSRGLAKYKPDAIINFAAESHVDKSIQSPSNFIQTNIVGTSVLLEEATKYYIQLSSKKKENFRFLQISSDEVFGELGKDGEFRENSPYNPSSPYSASKASAAHLVQAWHKTFGLPTLVTNCSNNYGPFQFPEKLIPLTIINAISNRPLPVYGKGDNIRDWLYVADNCRAIYKVLQSGKIGKTYNIASKEEKSNLEVVKTICEYLDKQRPRDSGESYKNQISFVKDRPGHDFRYAMDITNIKNELNWKPKFDFDSAIQKTINWYLKNKQWWKNVQLRKE